MVFRLGSGAVSGVSYLLRVVFVSCSVVRGYSGDEGDRGDIGHWGMDGVLAGVVEAEVVAGGGVGDGAGGVCGGMWGCRGGLMVIRYTLAPQALEGGLSLPSSHFWSVADPAGLPLRWLMWVSRLATWRMRRGFLACKRG